MSIEMPFEAKAFPYSVRKSLASSWIPLYFFLLAAVAGLMFFAAALGLFVRRDVGWFLGGLGLLGGGGILLLAAYAGGAYSWSTIRALVNKQRIVLEESCLQILIHDHEVLDEIPYDNIRRVFVHERHYEDPNVKPLVHVAIELRDRFRKDTIVSKNSPMQLAGDWEGPEEVHLIIRDHYDVEPKKLCSLLERRRKQALENHPIPPIETAPIVNDEDSPEVFRLASDPPPLPNRD